jgi:lysophospholipase L1-like esterase
MSGGNMKLVKTVLRIISAALIMGLAFIACDNQNDGGNGELVPEPEPLLVCFGDSLTAGYGASVPDQDDAAKAYPAYLEKKLTIPVHNAGVSGDTSEDGLARIEKDILSKNPRIVIIEFGANDILQVLKEGITNNFQVLTVIATTKSNLQSMIEMLDNGKRQIYIAKFYNADVVTAMTTMAGITDANASAMLSSQYNAMFASLLESRGDNVQLINDIWSGVWGDPRYMSGAVPIDIHPNAAGYEIMADKYFDDMEPYLEAAPADLGPAQWGAYKENAGEKAIRDGPEPNHDSLAYLDWLILEPQEIYRRLSVAVGNGKVCTQNIGDQLRQLGESGKGAQLCIQYRAGGASDWFLPSKDELDLMYKNLKAKGLGGFSNSWYWSSSERDNESAWYQRFSDGDQGYNTKRSMYFVRAVRAF